MPDNGKGNLATKDGIVGWWKDIHAWIRRNCRIPGGTEIFFHGDMICSREKDKYGGSAFHADSFRLIATYDGTVVISAENYCGLIVWIVDDSGIHRINDVYDLISHSDIRNSVGFQIPPNRYVGKGFDDMDGTEPEMRILWNFAMEWSDIEERIREARRRFDSLRVPEDI